MSTEEHIGSTMAWARAGRVVVTVHTESPVDQDEWVAYIEWVRRGPIPMKDSVALVRSDGGGPNALQRGMLTDLFATENAKVRTSVLTDSAFVRGLGIALSWFNSDLRIWSPEQVDQAFDHLGLDEAERQTCSELLDRLTDELRSKAPVQAR